VFRALEKLPADRFSSAAEFAAALLADAPRSASRRAPAGTMSTRRGWVLAAAVGTLALAAGAGLSRVLTKSPVIRSPVRKLAIALPDSMRVAFRGNIEAPGGQGSVTISADGKRIAWVGTAGREGRDVRLYVRDLDSYAISAVPGSLGAFAPFLSGDGSRLGYFSGRELREVSLANGETRLLVRDVPYPTGATYLADGSVLVATESGGLTLIAPGGGTRSLALSTTEGHGTVGASNFPSMVAGDRYAVALVRFGPVVVISLADGAVRRVRPFTTGDSAVEIVGAAPKAAGGRLYWLERDVVLSAEFDPERARLTSAPVPVVTGVRGDLLGAADFDVADDGTVVFVAGADPAVGHLAWLDRQGRVDTLPVRPADYRGFDISPDGRSLLTQSVAPGGAKEIQVFDVARGVGTSLDAGTGDVSQPGWSADGRSILVSVAPRGVGSARVLRVPVDGRSRPDTILPGGLDRQAVSRNGRVVILQVSTTRSPNRYLSDGENTHLFASRDGGPFEELPSLRGVVAPALSPDGRWVSYERYRAGQTAIFIERFPLDGRPMRVSADRGYEALFSAKGDRLFYRLGAGIMEVPLRTSGDSLSLGEPTPFVTFDFADFMGRGYKIGSDDRVLVKLLPSTTPQPEIRVVTAGG